MLGVLAGTKRGEEAVWSHKSVKSMGKSNQISNKNDKNDI